MPGQGSDPFVYRVAANLGRMAHLERAEQADICRRVLDLYAEEHREVHRFLRRLIDTTLVDEILEDEVFWAMVGNEVTRAHYAHAEKYLPALFATAALMAAIEDNLPLTREDRMLLSDS